MTIQELYDGLMPIAVPFAEEASGSRDCVVAASREVVCALMFALQEAADGNPRPMLDLAFLVGSNSDELRRQ